ncbi:MAG: ubiquinol-cytochrome C chaperone [Hyphomicrobiales bacterium]|nr:ubiquinol-cytochrome C chaperone [Hyphomicrobiales bacterium]
MFGFLRRDPNAALVERLNDVVMERARQPYFYADLGVADTLDGRFEMVCLHAALLVQRLNEAETPGPEIARDLTDAIFKRFEIALRETGVSDIAVPKRMKKLAANYLGRAQAYTVGLQSGEKSDLRTALARNVYLCEDAGEAQFAPALAVYAHAVRDMLATSSLREILDNSVDWPDPAAPGA